MQRRARSRPALLPPLEDAALEPRQDLVERRRHPRQREQGGEDAGGVELPGRGLREEPDSLIGRHHLGCHRADEPIKQTIAKFLGPWRARYGDRDPTWAGRGYDAVMFLGQAIARANTFDGEKVRDELERVSGFQGTSGAYNFDKSHYGITQNPFVLGQFDGDRLVIMK